MEQDESSTKRRLKETDFIKKQIKFTDVNGNVLCFKVRSRSRAFRIRYN